MEREIIDQKEFKIEGAFQSMYAAQKWLSDKGYSVGSASAAKPTAIMKGDYYSYRLPHKMKNFTKEEENSVHGLMSGDFRNGPVKCVIFC